MNTNIKNNFFSVLNKGCGVGGRVTRDMGSLGTIGLGINLPYAIIHPRINPIFKTYSEASSGTAHASALSRKMLLARGNT